MLHSPVLFRLLALNNAPVSHRLLRFTDSAISHRPSPLAAINLDPTDKHLTHEFEARDKNTQQTRNHKMADARPDIQPTALIPHHPEEIHRQYITYAHDNHEQTTWRDSQSSVENAEVGTDDGKGDEDFED